MKLSMRRLTHIAFSVMAILLILWAALQLRQRLFRRKVERLYADVREIAEQRNTPAEVRAFGARWSSHLRQEWGTEQTKYYYTDLEYSPVPLYGSYALRPLWAVRLLQWLGFRPAHVTLYYSTNDGVLAEYALRVDAATQAFHPTIDFAPSTIGYESITAASGRSTHLPNFAVDRVLHPYRTLRVLPRGEFVVAYTPFEARSEQTHLQQFDFSCLTALRPCRRSEDLLPLAKQEHEWEKERVNALEKSQCNLPFWVFARDSNAVIVADVLDSHLVKPGKDETFDPQWSVLLHVREELKGHLSGLKDNHLHIVLYPNDPMLTSGAMPKRLILAGRATELSSVEILGPVALDEPCDVVEATAANLAAAREGIRQDAYPEL